jgi:DNA-binding CsgD family transcriptional regulator
VLSLRATSALFRGRLGEAIGGYEQAVAALDEAREHAGVLMATFQLGIAQSLAGDERAPDTCDQAIMLSERLGEQLFRSYALWARGFHAWVHHDLDQAAALAQAGLLIQQGFNDHPGTALMIELLAWITASRREFGRAGRLLGALRAMWSTIGTSISAFGPHLADHHARCERDVIRALHTEAWQSALTEGGRMNHDQAIAYALGQPPAARAAGPGHADTLLTRRELEVAGLVAKGLSNREIAAALVVSRRTVDGHVEHILAKLGFTSRAQVAAWVAADGNSGSRPPG